MLKIAATRTYWKQDTKNSTVFSMFFDSNLLPSCDGLDFGGGTYLFIKIQSVTGSLLGAPLTGKHTTPVLAPRRKPIPGSLR